MFSRTRLFICLPPRPLYKLRKLYSSLNISVSMYYFFVNISIDKVWKEHIQILHHTLWICYISYLQKVILNIARRSVSRLIRLIRDRIANSSSFTKLFAEAPVQLFINCLFYVFFEHDIIYFSLHFQVLQSSIIVIIISTIFLFKSVFALFSLTVM